MNDDELRSALRAAVPEPPHDPGRAARARHRAVRRSRVQRSLVAGAAVSAVIGALLWWPSPVVAGRTATPAEPMAPPAAGAPGNPDCSPGLTGRASLRPRGRTEVSRVSLCSRSDGPTFTTPADPVTAAASAVFDAVLALPAESSRDPDCSRDGDRRYLVVFTLADGSRQVLEAATPNACGVTDGSAAERRWTGLLNELGAAWARQRSGHPVPGTPTDCLPFDRPGLLPPRLTDLDAGTFCLFDPAGRRLRGSAGLAPDQMRVLASDLTANSSRADNIDSRLVGRVLTLRNRWGDALVLWGVEGGQWFAFLPEGRQRYWSPGPEARNLLAALSGAMERADPTPPSVSPAR